MTTKQQQKDRETAVIRAPHDGSEVGVVSLAARKKCAARSTRTSPRAGLPHPARIRARRGAPQGRRRPRRERADLARTLARGASPSPGSARAGRAVFVFRDAAEEATRISGEVLPADAVPRAPAGSL